MGSPLGCGCLFVSSHINTHDAMMNVWKPNEQWLGAPLGSWDCHFDRLLMESEKYLHSTQYVPERGCTKSNGLVHHYGFIMKSEKFRYSIPCFDGLTCDCDFIIMKIAKIDLSSIDYFSFKSIRFYSPFPKTLSVAYQSLLLLLYGSLCPKFGKAVGYVFAKGHRFDAGRRSGPHTQASF